MARCQAVKDRVLSRGRSHAYRRHGEGWQRDSPVGRSSVEARPVLQPEEFGRLRLGSGLKGQGTGAQAWVKGGAASLPARMWDWLSGDVPDARYGRWVNSPLQGHRAAVVVVACS